MCLCRSEFELWERDVIGERGRAADCMLLGWLACSGCNPYDLPGILNVSSDSAEVGWVPVDPNAACQPVDFLEKIRQVVDGEVEDDPDLDFVRGRTILIIGDSVDRESVRRSPLLFLCQVELD